jgi:hypothetical protein
LSVVPTLTPCGVFHRHAPSRSPWQTSINLGLPFSQVMASRRMHLALAEQKNRSA